MSYSPGLFGGIKSAQQLRLIFAELGAISIPSPFAIPKIHEVFDINANLLDKSYVKRFYKFMAEYEWYTEALKRQRERGTPYYSIQ